MDLSRPATSEGDFALEVLAEVTLLGRDSLPLFSFTAALVLVPVSDPGCSLVPASDPGCSLLPVPDHPGCVQLTAERVFELQIGYDEAIKYGMRVEPSGINISQPHGNGTPGVEPAFPPLQLTDWYQGLPGSLPPAPLVVPWLTERPQPQNSTGLFFVDGDLWHKAITLAATRSAGRHPGYRVRVQGSNGSHLTAHKGLEGYRG